MECLKEILVLLVQEEVGVRGKREFMIQEVLYANPNSDIVAVDKISEETHSCVQWGV